MGFSVGKLSTVVALATPVGEGGLAVVRISGPEAFVVANQVFSGGGFSLNPEPRRAVYGILKSVSGSSSVDSVASYVIDRALVLPFKGPASYTGEDTVEFFCHGGRMVAQAVIKACRKAGAEPAAAGEFTRRAFLNGKLSLDQAEAVADLIHAQSELGARAAVQQLLGGLNQQLSDIEEPLLDLLSALEGSLEFVSEEDVSVPLTEVEKVLLASVGRLDKLIEMSPAGRLLRDGVHVVLAGAPNVGKSSLFNALLREERAIVDGEAGTTRDVVSSRIQRGGSVFVLHDTAGLRDDAGRVEQMGIERTWRQVNEADIILSLTITGRKSVGLSVDSSAPVISVFTKHDLEPSFDVPDDAVVLSSETGEGIDKLWQAIDRAVVAFQLEEAVALGVVLNERHLYKLTQSRQELHRLYVEVKDSRPGEEIIGSLLSSILSGLGEVSGRVFTEHMLESVFRRFCVGK